MKQRCFLKKLQVWREPLNALALLAQELPMMHKKGHCDVEHLNSNANRMMQIIREISKMIDIFGIICRVEDMEFDVRETVPLWKSVIHAQRQLVGIKG